eukprot:gene14649-biopygen12651
MAAPQALPQGKIGKLRRRRRRPRKNGKIAAPQAPPQGKMGKLRRRRRRPRRDAHPHPAFPPVRSPPCVSSPAFPRPAVRRARPASDPPCPGQNMRVRVLSSFCLWLASAALAWSLGHGASLCASAVSPPITGGETAGGRALRGTLPPSNNTHAHAHTRTRTLTRARACARAQRRRALEPCVRVGSGRRETARLGKAAAAPAAAAAKRRQVAPTLPSNRFLPDPPPNPLDAAWKACAHSYGVHICPKHNTHHNTSSPRPIGQQEDPPILARMCVRRCANLCVYAPASAVCARQGVWTILTTTFRFCGGQSRVRVVGTRLGPLMVIWCPISDVVFCLVRRGRPEMDSQIGALVHFEIRMYQMCCRQMGRE